MKKNLIALLALTLCLLLFACGEKKADEPDAPDVPDTPTVDPAPPEKTPAATAGRPSLNGACSKTTASRPTTTRISETASIRSM